MISSPKLSTLETSEKYRAKSAYLSDNEKETHLISPANMLSPSLRFKTSPAFNGSGNAATTGLIKEFDVSSDLSRRRKINSNAFIDTSKTRDSLIKKLHLDDINIMTQTSVVLTPTSAKISSFTNQSFEILTNGSNSTVQKSSDIGRRHTYNAKKDGFLPLIGISVVNAGTAAIPRNNVPVIPAKSPAPSPFSQFRKP